MDTASAPATGDHTTDGRPHGRTSLTPHLVVTPAAEALRFYADVLGARIHTVTRFGEAIAHAELELDDGWFTLSDPVEGYDLVAPDPARGVSYSLALYVPDTDEVVARALASGATVREQATTFVSGDRFASIRDPFGVRWSIMTRVKHISSEESARRVAEWAKAQTALRTAGT